MLVGQRPTNLGHHDVHHSEVDGDLSHNKQTDRQTDAHTDKHRSHQELTFLTSLSKMTRKSDNLQMLGQRQHLLFNYFKTLSVGPAVNLTRASRTID